MQLRFECIHDTAQFGYIYMNIYIACIFKLVQTKRKLSIQRVNDI